MTAIVFDLDDTLLDTQNQLVPAASRESCSAMIKAGLRGDVEVCVAERRRFMRQSPRENVYQHLVEHFGLVEGSDPAEVCRAGFQAFHERRIDPPLTLFSGASELLEKLKVKYELFLVTAGHKDTQKRKVQLLEIENYFTSIFYVDPSIGENKGQAFQEIQKKVVRPNAEFLSVGNRVDSDLAPAKSLGWKTCWVKTGEYVHLKPADRFEIPDFEISNIVELEEACQL